MRAVFGALAVLAVITMCCAFSGTASAAPKVTYWTWGPSHWRHQDFKPYDEDSKRTHNSQWNNQNWKPQDWIAQRHDGENLLRSFYAAGILHDQYSERGVLVLEIGPAFYMLGGQDRRRVTQTVDEVYQVTASRPNGMFMLHDSRSKKPIGAYTRYGLQMQ